MSVNSGTRPLIMVAEDEAIIAIDLVDSLRTAGFEVAGPFTTCAAAQEWLKTSEPDAAIIDDLLEDGPCDEVVADLSRKMVPTVIFSGHDEKRGTSEDWIATWLTKPTAFPILLDALKREM